MSVPRSVASRQVGPVVGQLALTHDAYAVVVGIGGEPMHRIFVAAIAAAGFSVGIIATASAADLLAAPVYKVAPAVSPSGWYIYEDGMYDSVRLPTYALGLHTFGAASPFPDAGALNTFSPQASGGGGRGGIGYYFPGSQLRLELGGSYLTASSKQNAAPTSPVVPIGAVLLNGTNPGGGIFGCGGGPAVTCTSAGQLNSDYTSWQIDGKVAYGMRWGGVDVSPSATLFGGTSRNNQSLNQSFSITSLAPTSSMTYGANTALTWNDFGGKLGLDATVPLTNWLSWSFSGSAGVADRMVSLNGSDSAIDTFAVFNGASTISASTTTTAFVGNLESGFGIKPLASMTLRMFGGVNFDNRVPGISMPGTTNPTTTPVSTPAGINFSSEASYYVGGGAIWNF
jgi:hypothetical protein